MAVHEPNRQDGSRTPSPASLSNDDDAGYLRASRQTGGIEKCSLVPLGSERPARRRPPRNGSVGISIQDKLGLVQDPKGWRSRRARRRVLLQKRDRTSSLWNPRPHADPSARAAPGQRDPNEKGRTF